MTAAVDPIDLVRRVFDRAFHHPDEEPPMQYLAPNYVDISPFPTPAPGREGFRSRLDMLHGAFSDVRFEVGDMVADGELVAFTWTFSGTHTGALGPLEPTGRQVQVGGMNFERVRDGLIVEHRSSFDTLLILRQLEALHLVGMPAGGRAHAGQ